MYVSCESNAQPSSDAESGSDRAAPFEERAIASHELFGGAREVMIVHQQAKYRLRITRQGKLILTK